MFRTFDRLEESQLREIKKILIIQQKPFGDILLNTGYLPELRRHFPDARIDYLIQRPYLTVMEDNPHLDNLVIMEAPRGRGLGYILPQIAAAARVRKNRYDLIIDQLRGTSSARIIIFSGARYRLGYIKKGWNFLYNVQIPQARVCYRSIYKFYLLAPLGIDLREHNLEYKIRPASFDYIQKWLQDVGLNGADIIAISAGSPVKAKRWNPGSFAALGDMIQRQTDFKIVLPWAPGEKSYAEEVAGRMQTKALLSPPTSFNEAGALLNFTKLLICNDGGLNHLAFSQKTPSVSIFGPKSNPLKWCPWHRREYVYLKDMDNRDLEDDTFNITPDQVFEKVQALLKVLDGGNSSRIDSTR
ncbi:MAG: glycosyltransferase family 9 protein [Deltaproteobacteria bacterium]|nr:glycosyltransferase family 9 protein [Deltaproteobacteria bacterium]